MARVWTPRERREHTRKKYAQRSHQLVTFILLLIIVVALLGVVLSNYVLFLPPQFLGALMFAFALFIVLFSVYKVKVVYIHVLIAVLALFFVSTVVLSLDLFGGITQLIWVVVVAVAFLIIIAILVFLTDLVWYEYQ